MGMMNRAPLIMVGATSHPDKTLADLIARAKAKPDQLSMATAGVGTSTHMAAALFLHQTGVRMLHVPYKGNAAAMPDVVGGRVQRNLRRCEHLRARSSKRASYAHTV